MVFVFLLHKNLGHVLTQNTPRLSGPSALDSSSWELLDTLSSW